MNHCPACGEAVSDTARFCSACGVPLAEPSASVRQSASVDGLPPASETKHQTETVELAQELDQLHAWGGNNALAEFFDDLFPFAGKLVRLFLFVANPLWIVTAAFFAVQGTERLKKGDVAGARRSLSNGRFANWIMILVGIIAWTVFIKLAQPGGSIYRMFHEPKVEIVQSATDENAAEPASPSIRAEMRQALTGGHVLQVWNETTSPVTCIAMLNNPELRSSPTHRFTLEPGAEKPKELGIKQFGHRIKKKPRCSVTIKVEETGEVYKFTP